MVGMLGKPSIWSVKLHPCRGCHEFYTAYPLVALDDAEQPLVAIWSSWADNVFAVGGDEPVHVELPGYCSGSHESGEYRMGYLGLYTGLRQPITSQICDFVDL